MDKNSLHFKGTYRNVYEVNRAYPNGGVNGDYVDINGWQHWWNPDRGTWCVNENRDSYWDEVLSTIQNLLYSKACVSESDFPLNPTDEEKRFGYFYNGQLYLWTGTNGTVRNGQYRSFGVVQGERGVGVSSIAQTSTSNVDGGKNEITVTLTNGDSYKFFTYNGTGRNKGYYYKSLDELKQAVPTPSVTDWAVVDGSVYVCEEAGVWKDTTYSWKPIKLNPFVTELNKLAMPTTSGYLHWDGQTFNWQNPVVNSGDNQGGGATVDLTQYSWWGRKFDKDTNTIVGAMSSVTSIEFLSSKDDNIFRKKLYLDDNGDLCFDGNFYATGGITALGVSNSSTTSNNVDFTFNSVTAKKLTINASDNEPFKIIPQKDSTDYLKFYYSENWNIYANNGEIRFQYNCTIDNDGWVLSPCFRYDNQSGDTEGNMYLDGYTFNLGDSDYDASVMFYYNGIGYKLNMSKAISLGVFSTASTQDLEAMEAKMKKKSKPVVQPASESDRAVQIGEPTESSETETDETNQSESTTDTSDDATSSENEADEITSNDVGSLDDVLGDIIQTE